MVMVTTIFIRIIGLFFLLLLRCFPFSVGDIYRVLSASVRDRVRAAVL
jgi:hypothetical protein